MQLKPSQVHVTENGDAVAGTSVIPVAEAHAKDFGVVLAIDASTSMEGKPERAAFYAAQAFAAQRKGQEQLAVVTYNLSPTVVLPFTTDQPKIDRALSVQPPFVYGTHIYDAVVHSLGELRKAHINAGTLVLLSDGQEQRGRNDVAKHETAESAAAAARAAHVRIFAVGLRSRLSNLETLRKLARETGGRYVETTSIAQLAAIYNDLGPQLANDEDAGSGRDAVRGSRRRSSRRWSRTASRSCTAASSAGRATRRARGRRPWRARRAGASSARRRAGRRGGRR